MAVDLVTLGLTAQWGSVRAHAVIEVPAAAAWERIADVPNNASWFTSLVKSWCDTDPETGRPVRFVTTPTGVTMTEDILLVDHDQRRLQYRLRANPIMTHHLATIDVIELSVASCLVMYSTDLAPRPLALAFGAATQRALDTLKQQLESPARTSAAITNAAIS
jgi:hypothetical protein